MTRNPIPHAVYRMFSADGRLLYVGCTFNPFQRIKAHEGVQPWVTDARTVTMDWFPSKADAMRAEADAIKAEQPEWNVHHRPEPKHSIGVLHAQFDRNDPSTWGRPKRASAKAGAV